MSWPHRFTGNMAAGQWLSDEGDTLVSAIDVYDGDLWIHALWRGGVELDRFDSQPDYFTDDPEEVARLSLQWSGNAETVAAAFGRPVDQVAPYLVHPYAGVDPDEQEARPEFADVRAFPDDESTLDDVWVFVDFWRRLGIAYPGDDELPKRCIRFACAGPDALPSDFPSL